MKNKLARWIAGIFGLEILDIELSELVEEEKEEIREEEKIKDLLVKKKEIMEKLSAGLSNVTEISQVYTARNMLKLIFGKQGLLKLNDRLKNLDEKLKEENRKELEDLKKERKDLRKEGLDEAFTIEQRIYEMHSEMKGLFDLFDDRIKEENRILSNKETFGRLLRNTMMSITKLNELNDIILELRKDLSVHEHETLRKNWQKRILNKFDEINSLSMSGAERKELLSHVRKHLTNPIKAKYKDAEWVNELEMRLERHEHMKKSQEWETKLERAIWDLSEEIRKEKLIQKHMEKALAAISEEMKRFKIALEGREEKMVA
ncbi:hypothetical protein KY345_05460 [Candidatus Woesearchaeota archaeon]|nr:hypothetical protein [Candidatus Woesearchaeota archaeon]